MVVTAAVMVMKMKEVSPVDGGGKGKEGTRKEGDEGRC